jgi:hypothetical protein
MDARFFADLRLSHIAAHAPYAAVFTPEDIAKIITSVDAVKRPTPPAK